MKRTAMLLAGGLISGGLMSGALVGGPALASGSDDLGVTDVCGDGFVLVGQTKIEGPSGRESLGRIVQATDATTQDACAFVTLKKDRGTTGTLTITAQSAASGPLDGAWDETDATDEEIDLDDEFTSDPSFFTYPDAGRAALTVSISGTALQGKQHGVKRVVTVPATKAEKKQAKRAYKKAVKAARKALLTHEDDDRFKRAVKRARERRDDTLDGHEKHVIVQVGVPTPFSTTATRAFVL